MTREKDLWMICKVQVSLFGKSSTLIYNKGKKWWYECERAFGEKLLGDDLKGYFKVCHRKNGELYIDKRVSDKDW